MGFNMISDNLINTLRITAQGRYGVDLLSNAKLFGLSRIELFFMLINGDLRGRVLNVKTDPKNPNIIFLNFDRYGFGKNFVSRDMTDRLKAEHTALQLIRTLVNEGKALMLPVTCNHYGVTPLRMSQHLAEAGINVSSSQSVCGESECRSYDPTFDLFNQTPKRSIFKKPDYSKGYTEQLRNVKVSVAARDQLKRAAHDAGVPMGFLVEHLINDFVINQRYLSRNDFFIDD